MDFWTLFWMIAGILALLWAIPIILVLMVWVFVMAVGVIAGLLNGIYEFFKGDK